MYGWGNQYCYYFNDYYPTIFTTMTLITDLVILAVLVYYYDYYCYYDYIVIMIHTTLGSAF